MTADKRDEVRPSESTLAPAATSDSKSPARGFTRRAFLGRSGMLAAAAGIGAAAPAGLGMVLSDGEQAPAVPVAGLSSAAANLDGPLVAHIRDAATGEIGIFTGTRELIVHDTALVGRLLHIAG